MSRNRAILNFLVFGLLSATLAYAASTGRATAQSGTNLVQNRGNPDLLLNVQGGAGPSPRRLREAPPPRTGRSSRRAKLDTCA
jgi:hypothetical protein